MRSPAGQSMPRPSPPQNVPNVTSITPTANLRPFSGTIASGRRITMATTSTARAAIAAPRAADGKALADAPNVMTMNATSSPSSRTPLKATVKLIQSMPVAGTGGSARSAAISSP